MKLSDKQAEFCDHIGLLIVWASAPEDRRVRFADAYRDPRVFGEIGQQRGYGRANSLHKQRLAVDLVLDLYKGGRWIYQTSTEAYKPLGEFWESLHPENSWGGHFADGNHFSRRHAGRR